jgi:hypothetical protein
VDRETFGVSIAVNKNFIVKNGVEVSTDLISLPECEPWLSKHQAGQFFDCNDNGRARDAGNDQKCIDNVLGKNDPFGDGRQVRVEKNWGKKGHCKD